MFFCEILSGLWIGDTDIMLSKKFLTENDIKIIINFTIDMGFPDSDEITKVRISVSEQLKYSNDTMKLNANLNDIFQIIKDNTDKNNILLVCYDGKNVSALVSALYIVKNSSISKENIRQILNSKCEQLSLDYELSVFDT
tara:strand:+ start:1138 stop:1557 length:420 start_codon:yes stop_codon:yes gene_type:complete